MKKTKPLLSMEKVRMILILAFLTFLAKANLPEENNMYGQLKDSLALSKTSRPDTIYGTSVTNGDFSNGFEKWNAAIWGDAKGSFTIENGMAKLKVDSTGTYTYNIMLYQGLSLNDKSEYTIEFDIKSEVANRPFEVVVEHYGVPYNKYLWEKYTTSSIYNEIKHFQVKLKMKEADPKTKLGFHFGSHKYGTGTVWIGNISIKQ
jgi:hypothetical protein